MPRFRLQDRKEAFVQTWIASALIAVYLFMDDVVKVPEVRFAFLVTGRYDLVVHVVVRDTKHLKDLALDQFTNRPGVTRIETSIIFDARPPS